MADDRETLKARAIAVRDRFLHGDITFEQAKTELKPFVAEFNRAAAEIAAKWNQKPKKLSVGEFLRAGFVR